MRSQSTLLLVMLLIGGCSASGVPEEADEKANATVEAEYPAEIGSFTAYYTGGPQQGRPPDGQLEPGTRVKVLENAGSYALIRTADGIEAYVSTAAIQTAGSSGE